jgi:UDP-galactopyranose mutase
MISNLIVGAGLSGATLARKLADAGQKVLVIEKRNHIGGNTYDYTDKETGIRLSQYGAHIFHTNSEEVWKFVNRFSDWNIYRHKVLSYVNGKYVPVPVNITTVNELLGLNIQNISEMQEWLKENQIKGEIKNSKDSALARVGRKLYKLMFENYTKKQWDLDPAELEPSVLERIPVRENFNDRYFSDKYEALPSNGYTEFVSNMLNHENIEVRLNEEYNPETHKAERLFFTGKIDTYFSDRFGKLEYRSLVFNYKTYKVKDYQPSAVVNYPSLEYPYTRKIDYKKFYETESEYSVIAEEFSTNNGEEYYPVPTPLNREIYAKYQEEAKKLEKENIYFVGRLAEYKYFNMDQAILSALQLYDRIFNDLE